MGQGGKCPVKPLGCVNVTNVTCKLKRLKLMGSWFPERSANFYSVLSREHSTVNITILCIFALRQSGMDLMIFQTND